MDKEVEFGFSDRPRAPDRIHRIDDFETRQNATDAWDLAVDLVAVVSLLHRFAGLGSEREVITSELQSRISARFPELAGYRVALRCLRENSTEPRTEDEKRRFCAGTASLMLLLQAVANLIIDKATVLCKMGVNDPAFDEAEHKVIKSIRFDHLLEFRVRERTYQPFEFSGKYSQEVRRIGAGAANLVRLLEAAPVVALQRAGRGGVGGYCASSPCLDRHQTTGDDPSDTLVDELSRAMPTTAPPAGVGAKRNATRDAAAPTTPRWDSETRQLWYGDVLCWEYKREAKNQMQVLEGFQTAGWPESITNPLSCGNLRQTIDDMMEKKGG